MARKVVGTIKEIKKLPNSINGNPRFRVTVESEFGLNHYTTAADYSFNHQLSENDAGQRVELIVKKAITIVEVKKLA